MKRWFVVTPDVSYVDVIVDGQGPLVYEPDVIEIEADTPRDAISLGVQLMLKGRAKNGDRYRYCRDQRSSNLSPYSGVKAVEVTD